MAMRALSANERRTIEQARVARLSTVGADGSPHVIPICPVLFDDKIVIGLEGGSRKQRNVAGDPRVAVLFDDYMEDWDALRGVLVSGLASPITNADERAAAIEAMYRKFPQYPELAALGDDDPIIAVEPTAIASWGFDA